MLRGPMSTGHFGGASCCAHVSSALLAALHSALTIIQVDDCILVSRRVACIAMRRLTRRAEVMIETLAPNHVRAIRDPIWRMMLPDEQGRALPLFRAGPVPRSRNLGGNGGDPGRRSEFKSQCSTGCCY